MQAKKIHYNIMGQGSLRTFKYPYTQRLYTFLNNYKYNDKFHSMKQLGTLQHLLKGAHHTRYEYIFLQWTIIHEMCKANKSSGLGSMLNQNYDEFKIGKKRPTGAEILQSLSILTNMGHLPDTFTASKALLYLLKNNTGNIRTEYRNGLDPEDRILLKDSISNSDVYKIHLINTLFLLNRYKRQSDSAEIISYSKWLIREYIKNDNEELIHLWERYRFIRKVSFLILDSNYAPIPFKLDLSSIILLLEESDESMILSNSSFQSALNQINEVLENTLYIAPNSTLFTNLKREQLLKNIMNFFNENESQQFNISRLTQTLSPQLDGSSYASFFLNKDIEDHEVDWEFSRVLEIKYPANIMIYLKDTNIIETEDLFIKKLGQSAIRCSIDLPPNQINTRLTIALKKEYKNKLRKSLEVVNELITFNEKLFKKGLELSSKDSDFILEQQLEFILSFIFNDVSFEFYKPITDKSPIFYARGSQKLAENIKKYINEIETSLHSDLLHEYNTLLEYLKEISYRGLIMCYLGGIKVKDFSGLLMEMDGFICKPNIKDSTFSYILEAKNKRKGSSEAVNQLTKNLNRNLNPEITTKIEKIGERNAVAELTIT